MKEKPAILMCTKPYEGQPKTGITVGKCELCAADVIYDPLNLERVKELHAEAGVQVVCEDCVTTVCREEITAWGGVFVKGRQYLNQDEGAAVAKKDRLEHGGTK